MENSQLLVETREVLETMIEMFREKSVPSMKPERFRAVIYELMAVGAVRIYQEGDNFRFGLTPEGQEMFSELGR
jgi:predicted transcriptional regulator